MTRKEALDTAAALASPGPASVAAWRICNDRAEELDQRLHAWAWHLPADAGIVPDGKISAAGALDGFVVAVKDVIDVAGMPTRSGSPLTAPDRWRPTPRPWPGCGPPARSWPGRRSAPSGR